MTIVSRPTRHRRCLRYIDEQLQRTLLIGLVVLEAVLVAVLAWLMHRHLSQIVKENLYRAHLPATGPIFVQLMHEAVFLIGMFLIANVVALLVGDMIWRRHVNSVLRRFMGLIGKTGQLDFSSDPELVERHPLLVLAKHHRIQERRRLAAIREQFGRVEKHLMEPTDFKALQLLLNDLKRLLPSTPANDHS